MIKAYTSKSLLSNKMLAYTKSKEELSFEELDKLEKIKLINFKFDDQIYDFEEAFFFKEFVKTIIDQSNLFFVFIEKKPKQVSKSRSYKGQLYAHQKGIGKEYLFEQEVFLSEKTSLFYTIVFINSANVTYVCTHLINSLFAFACLFDRQMDAKEALDKLPLQLLIKEAPYSKGIFELNDLKLIASLVNEHTALFKRFVDGADNSYLHLFYTQEEQITFVKSIEKTFKIVHF